MLELHDRERFEIFLFSFGPDPKDPWRARAMKACEKFLDLRVTSIEEVVSCARNLKLDIAVDLKGFTEDSRPEIFKARVAPVQISYLGYPGTSGLPEMDYIIADAHVIPEEFFGFYDEKVIQLPDAYQTNCRHRNIASVKQSRRDLGLPHDGFIFCSFNASHKISPEMFEAWIRILRRVPESVLWILINDTTARSNLWEWAKSLGLDANRIVFCSNLPVEAHLGRLSHADLLLDTFPYNAHTTASDALRMGVPVLTLSGKSFASRVSGSLLKVSGMEDLIVESLGEYENLAVEIALDPNRLAQLRARMHETVPASALYNSERFTRFIETAFEMVTLQHLAGLPPAHIYRSQILAKHTHPEVH
jgi:predicted O-linked N-acetylglucosamine transferase (SPINDLY family)